MATQNNSLDIVNIQLAAWREQMLNRLLPWTAAIGTVAIALGSLSVIQRERWLYLPIYLVVYLLLLFVTLNRRLGYQAKATIVLLLIATLGVTVLSETGLNGVGRPFLLILPVAAMVLLNWRSAALGLLLGTTVLVAFGLITGNTLDWLLAATINAMLVTGVVISLHLIIQRLTSTVEKEQKARQQLRDISDHLEQKAAKHAAEMERRTQQLQAAGRIHQLANKTQDVDEALAKAVDLLVEQLDLHHVSVLLLEPNKTQARLRAAAGEAAGRVLESGRVVNSGERSLVGWCLESGESQVRPDNSQMFHPLLPETRATMVLPLRLNGQLMGALEVHSTTPAAFDDSDLAGLQNIANHLALMLENLRLHQHRPGAGGWTGTRDAAAASAGISGFAEYHQAGRSPWSAEDIQQLTADEEQANCIHLPLIRDGQEIGHLIVESPSPKVDWSEADMVTIASLAEQTLAALDGAQALEESRRQASRERLMTQIAAQVRSSLDPDTILKTTVRELGRALGARLATVEITPPGRNGDRLTIADTREEEG